MSALWTAKEASTATGGRTESDWSATGVSIDSRTLRPGDLFVALAGARDGHDFAAGALAKGAAAALVTRRPHGVASDARLLIVSDTQAGLEALGRARRAESKARIVAVTGSVGKTSTKEALRAALGLQGPTHASEASYNNLWGVPLTLARMPKETQFGVFEIGMNHAGEITPLTRQVRPHVAIITTVEAVHLENFDSVDGIADAKAEILLGLEPGGVAVLNRDNPYFNRLAGHAERRAHIVIATFGAHPEADARLVDMRLEPAHSDATVSLHGKTLRYRLGAPGRHVVFNSLAILLAAEALGADVEAAAASFAQMSAPKGRGAREVLTLSGGSVELIDESYNANPASMRAAIALLGQARPGPGGRRIAVLGDMLELGPTAGELHAGLAPALAEAKTDLVFACGPLMAQLYAALPGASRALYGQSSADIAEAVAAELRPGDVVMVKGSFGSRMALVIEALRSRAGTAR